MYISGLEACRQDLYSPEKDLKEKYPPDIVEKVIRCRAMHQWMLANPAAKDALFIAEDVERHGISRPAAYSDLEIVKAMLPHLARANRDFHQWRFFEMILKVFDMAERRKDARTMERAVATYAKYAGLDREEKPEFPIDKIIVQPFVATSDPSVLGIKPIPNLRQRQRELIERFTKESTDIRDITFEEVDLREDELFDES